jgi:two-component system CheB/CheR fusion protein
MFIVNAPGHLGRYSDAAAEVLAIAESDGGRAIDFLRAALGGLDLTRLVTRAVDRVTQVSEDTVVGNGRWYKVMVRPCATAEGVIDGALVTLEDIDDRKRSSALAVDVAAYAEKVLSAVAHPLVMLDPQHRVIWANGPFFATFRVTPSATLGNLFQHLGNGQWAHPRLRELLDGTLIQGKPFDHFKIDHNFEEVGAKSIKVDGRPLRGIAGQPQVALVSMVDVSVPS